MTQVLLHDLVMICAMLLHIDHVNNLVNSFTVAVKMFMLCHLSCIGY